MKHLILSVLFMFAFDIQAQIIRAGAAADFTSGNYSGTNILRSDNLFAQNGFSYGLSFDYSIRKNILLQLETGQSNHPFNESAFSNALTLLSGIQTIALSATDYRSSWMMIGAGFKIPKGKLTYQVEVHAGLLNMTTPSYLLQYNYPANSGTELISSNHVSSYAFSWALRIQYEVYRNWVAGCWLRNMTSTLDLPVKNYSSSDPITAESKLEVYQTGLFIGYKLY